MKRTRPEQDEEGGADHALPITHTDPFGLVDSAKKLRAEDDDDLDLSELTKEESSAGADDVEESESESKSEVMNLSGAVGRDDESSDPDTVAIVKAIKAKPNWTLKVADPEIAKRYATEAARQGASAASIAAALRQLLIEATQERGVECTLQLPSDRWDRDFSVGEYDNLHEDGEMKADEVRYIDGLVPEELRMLLEAQLDAIANEPEKDFHPGTDRKVQDLIHPSLYPYVRGVSYVRTDEDELADEGSIDDEEENEDEEKEDEPEASRSGIATGQEDRQEVNAEDGLEEVQEEEEEEEEEDIDDDDDDNDRNEDDEYGYGWEEQSEAEYKKKALELENLDSIYQWLPAEFDVQPDGEVHVASYINNLDRDRYAGLYDTIARIFRLFLPLLEQVTEVSSYWLPQFYGQRLQVIVKAANYILQPGQTYEGTWHVEGMPHEKIVASGIYYYSTSPNLPTTCLAFRTQREDDMHERQYTQSLGFDRNLGKVDTPAGRCLVFGNDLQHKVKAMTNSSDQVGTRKILCFFLVDPGLRVISSADVPEQQWDRVRSKVARALIEVTVKLSKPIPRELVKYIVDLAKWGFSKEEAHMHREVLMQERKYYVDDNNSLWERPFSFCEH